MIKKIISGGQSGADIASIDAAMANNFPYGEWIPKADGQRMVLFQKKMAHPV